MVYQYMESGYYVNQQNELVIVTPDQQVSVFVADENVWFDFKMTYLLSCVFEWDYLGEL